MLYISIVTLLIFILILIVVYRRYTFEQFAFSSGYIEDLGKSKKLKNAIASAEADYGQQKLAAIQGAKDLDAKLKNLKAEQVNIITRSKMGEYKPINSAMNYKIFDNKELYSILINGLNMASYREQSNSADPYGLKNINYNDTRALFTRTVTDTVSVSCELLKQKQDYRYVSKCINTIKDIDSAAKIHNLIIRAYAFTTNPSQTSNRDIDPYLVNKLNKNIGMVITLGRRVLFADTNTCKCKPAKNTKILKNQFAESQRIYVLLETQVTSMRARLRDASEQARTAQRFMSGLPDIIPDAQKNALLAKQFPAMFASNGGKPMNIRKLATDLASMERRKGAILSNMNSIKKTLMQNIAINQKGCQPC